MTWKLRTETDMETGEGARYFTNDETGTTVPESEALLLVKQIIKNFPAAVDALVEEISVEEGRSTQPPVPPQYDEEEESFVPVVPLQQQPQAVEGHEFPKMPVRPPAVPAAMQPRDQGGEPAHQPLDIPVDIKSQPSGRVSLKDFAPRPTGRGERDTGQL